MRLLLFLLFLPLIGTAQLLPDTISPHTKSIEIFASGYWPETEMELPEKIIIGSVKYNEQGLVTEYYIAAKGVRWNSSYSPLGQILSRQLWNQGDNQVWACDDSVRYVYDNKNVKLINYPSQYTTIRAFNTRGQLISEIEYDSKGKEISKYTCGYDLGNNLAWEEEQDNGVWTDSVIWQRGNGFVYRKSKSAFFATSYKMEIFDTEMKPVRVVNYKRTEANSGNWIPKQDSTVYTYDKMGHLIKQVEYVDQNELKENVQNGYFDAIMDFQISTEYIYNESGLLIEEKTAFVDNMTPEWKFIYVNSQYVYNQQGQKMAMVTTNQQGGFVAKTTFSYNDRGDLIRKSEWSETGAELTTIEYSYEYYK
jgi:hypothetical protein